MDESTKLELTEEVDEEYEEIREDFKDAIKVQNTLLYFIYQIKCLLALCLNQSF